MPARRWFAGSDRLPLAFVVKLRRLQKFLAVRLPDMSEDRDTVDGVHQTSEPFRILITLPFAEMSVDRRLIHAFVHARISRSGATAKGALPATARCPRAIRAPESVCDRPAT